MPFLNVDITLMVGQITGTEPEIRQLHQTVVVILIFAMQHALTDKKKKKIHLRTPLMKQ